MTALPLPVRLAVGAAHVGVVVGVAAACCLFPVPLVIVVALWPRRSACKA